MAGADTGSTQNFDDASKSSVDRAPKMYSNAQFHVTVYSILVLLWAPRALSQPLEAQSVTPTEGERLRIPAGQEVIPEMQHFVEQFEVPGDGGPPQERPQDASDASSMGPRARIRMVHGEHGSFLTNVDLEESDPERDSRLTSPTVSPSHEAMAGLATRTSSSPEEDEVAVVRQAPPIEADAGQVSMRRGVSTTPAQAWTLVLAVPLIGLFFLGIGLHVRSHRNSQERVR